LHYEPDSLKNIYLNNHCATIAGAESQVVAIESQYYLFIIYFFMNQNGPVVIIEDDYDDQEILAEVFKKLKYPNELIFFDDGQKALDFLTKTEVIPFIILSDINMPILNGFELRVKLKLDAQLAIKCIPYLYMSTALNQKVVIDAYSTSAQGFFIKQSNMAEIEKTIVVIMEYWKRCAAPNNFGNVA
jgi:CheY-like chemotaxis protein